MEAKTKINLSDKQREVIRVLQNGGLLTRRYSDNKFELSPFSSCEEDTLIDGRLVNSLEVKGVIYSSTYRFYKLTKLGKEINIA